MSPAKKQTPELQAAAAAWREVLASDSGRKVLRVILFKIAEIDAPVPVADALAMAHTNGRRSVGQVVRAQIEAADPMGFAGLLADDING